MIPKQKGGSRYKDLVTRSINDLIMLSLSRPLSHTSRLNTETIGLRAVFICGADGPGIYKYLRSLWSKYLSYL